MDKQTLNVLSTDTALNPSAEMSTSELVVESATEGLEDSSTMNLPDIFDFINATVGGVGVAGNLLVIFILAFSSKMKKNLPNLFIMSQSTVDTIVGVLLIGHTYFRLDDNRPTGLAGEIFCRIWISNGALWACIYVSIYNMLSMTCERYTAIVLPMWHNKHVTRKKGLVVICIVWSLILSIAVVHPIVSSKIVNGQCEVYSHWGSEESMIGFGVWIVFFLYIIPLAVIVYTYSHIWIVLKRNTGSEDAESHASGGRESAMKAARYNVIKLCLYVNIAYVFCFTMNTIIYTSLAVGLEFANMNFNSISYHLSVVFVFVNSCIYPFVYVIKYAEFQQAIKSLFCCRWRSQMNESIASMTSMSHVATVDDNFAKGDGHV